MLHSVAKQRNISINSDIEIMAAIIKKKSYHSEVLVI